MSSKNFIKTLINNFFIIVTFVNVAMFVLGSIFRPEQQFGYEVLLVPLLYGLLSLIPDIIMYSNRELTVKELYIRKFFHLISIEVLLYVFGYGIAQIREANIWQSIGFGISVLCVYILVNVFSALLNAKQAKELSDLFKDFQERANEKS